MYTNYNEGSDRASLPSLGELTVTVWNEHAGSTDGRLNEFYQDTDKDHYLCWRMRELCDAIYNDPH